MVPLLPLISIIIARFTSTLADSSPNSVTEGYLCPPGLDLVRAGQCRGPAQLGLFITAPTIVLSTAISTCKDRQTSPLKISNKEEQEYWTSIARRSNKIPLSITCNVSTLQWQWSDGSAITYKPPYPATYSIDYQCNTYSAIYLSGSGDWNSVETSMGSTYLFDIYCTSELLKSPITYDEHCVDFTHDEADSMCYQVSEAKQSYIEAEKFCNFAGGSIASIHSDQQNAFISRLAVSRGYTDGVILGGKVNGKSKTHEWTDGTPWNYTNFIPGFPVNGLGDCLGMDLFDGEGKWANIDCSTKLPFVCSRLPNSVSLDTSCPAGGIKEGEIVLIIRSPGYPTDASIPCDFFLIADAGKLVEIEILLLEANSCCDHLVLYEGSFGGQSIANLTGAQSGATYRTVSTNVMKASWQPNGGVNVRGLMFTFRSV